MACGPCKERGGTQPKPPRMPPGDDPRSGDLMPSARAYADFAVRAKQMQTYALLLGYCFGVIIGGGCVGLLWWVESL